MKTITIQEANNGWIISYTEEFGLTVTKVFKSLFSKIDNDAAIPQAFLFLGKGCLPESSINRIMEGLKAINS
jgi:hypothetical protein